MSGNELQIILIITAVGLMAVILLTAGIMEAVRRKKTGESHTRTKKIYMKNGVDIGQREVKEGFDQDIELIDKNDFETICVSGKLRKEKQYFRKRECEIRLVDIMTRELYTQTFFGELLIGRVWQRENEKSQLVLKHPGISKKHCRIFEENGRFYVLDEGSLNHTFVNQKEVVQKTPLCDGDILTIGECSYRVGLNNGNIK